MNICKHAGCIGSSDRNDNGKAGFCSKHYQRFRKHGSSSTVKTLKPQHMPWLDKHKTYSGNDCLKWPFHISSDGYGRCHIRSNGRDTLTTASRAMLLACKGPPDNPRAECAHSCGNGSQGCVNPNHLRWATPTENQHDRVIHKTSNRGSRQWKSRLREPDVLRILDMEKSMTAASIARHFAVAPATIQSILTGVNWSWLTGRGR